MRTVMGILLLAGLLEVFASTTTAWVNARMFLPVILVAFIPWLAAADLAEESATSTASPFMSSLAFAVGGPVYFALLPFSIEKVLLLGQSADAPIRFAAEFGVMVFTPIALILAPVVRIFLVGRPPVPSINMPAAWLWQGFTVLMLGIISLIMVAATGIDGLEMATAKIEAVDRLELTSSNIWGQVIRALLPMWFFGMLLSIFALAWGQLGRNI